jgi:hypothetical protein
MVALPFGTYEDWLSTHDIELNPECTYPNPDLLSLENLLKKPLPAWVSTGPYPFTSSNSSDLLDHLRSHDISLPHPSKNLHHAGDELSAVFDLVMSSTAIIRDELFFQRTEMCESQIIFLVGALMVQFFPEFSIRWVIAAHFYYLLTDLFSAKVEYALPRISLPDSHPLPELEPLYSSLALLLSYDVSKPAKARPALDHLGLSPSKVAASAAFNRESTSTASSTVYSNEEDNRGWNEVYDECDRVPSSTPSSSATEYEPVTEDVFTLAPSASCLVIPILCVAPVGEIVAAMASALYQRVALNLEPLVVGLAYSSQSTQVVIMFGWIEKDLQGKGGLVSSFTVLPYFN